MDIRNLLTMKKPTIGITIGDPASIGPEIAVKALTGNQVREISNPILFGDASVVNKTVKNLGVNDLAKGGLGRITIYTEEAIKELGEKLK